MTVDVPTRTPSKLYIHQDPTTKEWCVIQRSETIAAFKFLEHAELFINILLATERIST